MSAASPLHDLTERAGACMVGTGDLRAAAHYGSPAGELAVCLRTVGFADRSDLGKYVIAGRATAVAGVVRRVAGAVLAPSGVAEAAGAWWCAADAGSVLVLCEPAHRARLLQLLRVAARPLGQVEVRDASEMLSAIALLGPRMLGVLSSLDELGLAGDPRTSSPFGRFRFAGVETRLLLQSDHRSLLVCDAGDADRLWRALARAGQAFGMSCVGTEAIERLALVDRRAAAAVA